MSSEAVIKVSDLSKCYLIYDKPQDRLKQYVIPRLQRYLRLHQTTFYREFWALRNISFEVPRGATVGIIGRNGSGKSTLLQMICGTLTPTGGTVQTQGRIAALLELGSGFNPEFSGRENIYMNGSILGMDKAEIDEKLHQIIAFADIGDHLDQPTKTYSSGMTVRLAFAVQALCDPDILVVDEALAVGDARFQAKCFERLKQLKDKGTSILLVTHSSEQIVTHCNHAILIENGTVYASGRPRDVINTYHHLLFDGGVAERFETAESGPEQISTPLVTDISITKDLFYTHPGYNEHEFRWGDGKATLLDYVLWVEKNLYPQKVDSGSEMRLKVSIRFNQSVSNPILGITVKNREGMAISGTNTEMLNTPHDSRWGYQGSVHIIETEFVCNLAPGDYFISLGIASREGHDIIPHDRRYDVIHFQVSPNPKLFGIADLKIKINAHTS